MPINVKESIIINRSRDEVAGYAMEPDNDPVWIGGIIKANLLTERPVGKGSKVERTAKFLGKHIEYVLEVTEFEPGKLMLMESIKSPFPMKVTYSFEGSSQSPGKETEASIRVEGNSKGFYKLTDFLMGPKVKKNIKGDLLRLKEILEK